MQHRPFTPISEGSRVRVRSRFDGSWAGGFEIAGFEEGVEDSTDPGAQVRPRYHVRRVTDRRILPTPFGLDEVVPQEYPGFDAQFWPGLP